MLTKQENHQPDLPSQPIRVVKLGGSLLESDRLFERLEQWHAQQPPMANVWLVGGGRLVSGLQDLHQRFQLDEAESHWLAVRLLGVTTGIVAQRFPKWHRSHTMSDLQDWLQKSESDPPSDSHHALFNCENWLRTQTKVPESWDVTTDSIAAMLANAINATECVLLKSTDAPPVAANTSRAEALASFATAGYCDAYMPTLAGHLPSLRLVNFRDADFAERRK